MRRALLWIEFVLVLSLVAGCDRAQSWVHALLDAPPERAVAWGDWCLADETRGLGSTTYRLEVPVSAEVMELDFGARLGGAAVEIVGRNESARFLLHERFRTHHARLRLNLDRSTNTVEVTVYHHLRAAPRLSGRAGWFKRGT